MMVRTPADRDPQTCWDIPLRFHTLVETTVAAFFQARWSNLYVIPGVLPRSIFGKGREHVYVERPSSTFDKSLYLLKKNTKPKLSESS